MNEDRLDKLRHALEVTLRKAGKIALDRFQRRDFTTLSKGAPICLRPRSICSPSARPTIRLTSSVLL